jgi:hypothetical protein
MNASFSLCRKVPIARSPSAKSRETRYQNGACDYRAIVDLCVPDSFSFQLGLSDGLPFEAEGKRFSFQKLCDDFPLQFHSQREKPPQDSPSPNPQDLLRAHHAPNGFHLSPLQV